jgi:hypothetical protein
MLGFGQHQPGTLRRTYAGLEYLDATFAAMTRVLSLGGRRRKWLIIACPTNANPTMVTSPSITPGFDALCSTVVQADLPSKAPRPMKTAS